MSDLRVTNLKGRTPGSAPTLPDGAVITGITTVSSVIVGTGITLSSSGINVTGVITATSFFGSGANLTGVGLGTTGSINTSGIITATSIVVSAGTTAAPSISPTGDSNTGIFFPSADTIAFAEGGTEALRVDSSGRLLVGTITARTPATYSSPRIQIEATSYTSAALSIINNENNNNEAGFVIGKSRGTSVNGVTSVNSSDTLGQISFQGADGTNLLNAATIKAEVDGTPSANDMPGRLVFSTTADGASSQTERMRIGSAGQFFTFTTSGDAFDVGQGQSAGTSVSVFVGRHSSASNLNSGTVSVRIFNNGNIQNTNNSYGSLSDIKLKENIVNSGSQWNDIKSLQVRKYNFKEETGHQTHTQIGLVAQEVELVSPGLVSESPDRETIEIPVLDSDGNQVLDQDGNPQVSTEERETGTVTKSVNYSVLYMKAVKALQEAMERIETLEQRLIDAGIA